MQARILVVGAATALLLVGPMPVATAQTLRIDDSRGDVAAAGRDGDLVPARRATYPDLTSVLAAHRSASITLRARYRDLRPRGEAAAFSLAIATPDGSVVPYDVIAESGGRDGYIEPYEGTSAADFICSGEPGSPPRRPRWDIDYVRDVYRITVPRTCLGEPEWVRVGFVSSVDTGRRVLYDVGGSGRLREPIGSEPNWMTEPLFRS